MHGQKGLARSTWRCADMVSYHSYGNGAAWKTSTSNHWKLPCGSSPSRIYWDAFLLGQGPAGTYVRSIDLDRLQALRGDVKRRLSISGEGVPFGLSARVWSVRGTVPM